MKDNLLFYEAYENFYGMAQNSKCFKEYCISAFGEDFSQDGFSDVEQVNLIFQCIKKSNNLQILDIGCGNGKMLKYLQSKLGCHVSGFDYSENAINTALSLKLPNSDFRVGEIDKIDYPVNTFDLVTSMDTIYFSQDIKSFIGQVRTWLKPEGTFFLAYQEGDLVPKTQNCETTILAQSLIANGFSYQAKDITENTYIMLKRKRESILKLKQSFINENIEEWFDMVLNQTNDALLSYEEYQKKNARYIFVARL